MVLMIDLILTHRVCLFVCLLVCWQETKDTLDKEALYRCMASCFEAAHVRWFLLWFVFFESFRFPLIHCVVTIVNVKQMCSLRCLVSCHMHTKYFALWSLSFSR